MDIIPLGQGNTNRERKYMKNFYIAIGLCVGLYSTSALAQSDSVFIHSVTDHEKKRVYRSHSLSEICEKTRIQKDHTGNTLKGALIGGALGNNLLKGENTGAMGALLGAFIGHSESSKNSPEGYTCYTRKTPIDEVVKVYSHSVLEFSIDGVTYKVQFTKR